MPAGPVGSATARVISVDPAMALTNLNTRRIPVFLGRDDKHLQG